MYVSENDIAKLLISSSPEGVLVVDKQGIIVLVNDSLVKMFGYSKHNELVGNQMEMLVPVNYNKNHSNLRSKYHKSPSKRRMGTDKILYAKRKDGSQFAVEIGLNYIKYNDGMLISALISDISERVKIKNELTQLNLKLEEKVIERTQELESAILELQETNDSLEIQHEKTKIAEREAKKSLEKEKELGELKSRFVSMASHEFRTPLSTVLSSNSLIQKYIAKVENIDTSILEKITKHNYRINNSIKNLNEILNDLLSLAKIEEGKLSSKKDLFDITSLFDELKEEMSTYLKPNQKIKILHKGLKEIKSDRHLLHNILLNLTSNASKYSDQGKTITIHSQNTNKILTINITDEGIGIPKQDFNHMFERFFRAKNVTNIEGTGLGLNIVKKYLELMNGNITFTSELNIGSTFTIKLDLT